MSSTTRRAMNATANNQSTLFDLRFAIGMLSNWCRIACRIQFEITVGRQVERKVRHDALPRSKALAPARIPRKCRYRGKRGTEGIRIAGRDNSTCIADDTPRIADISRH